MEWKLHRVDVDREIQPIPLLVCEFEWIVQFSGRKRYRWNMDRHNVELTDDPSDIFRVGVDKAGDHSAAGATSMLRPRPMRSKKPDCSVMLLSSMFRIDG